MSPPELNQGDVAWIQWAGEKGVAILLAVFGVIIGAIGHLYASISKLEAGIAAERRTEAQTNLQFARIYEEMQGFRKDQGDLREAIMSIHEKLPDRIIALIDRMDRSRSGAVRDNGSRQDAN